MNASIQQDPSKKTIRLVDYLLRLASLRTSLVRDITEYEQVLWISNVPHERGCFTQAWGRDEEHEPDEWLEVQNRREPELPSVPDHCVDWVTIPSLRNTNDRPQLLQEIVRQIPNPDWHTGSDQPETIPHTEHLEDHPEVQRAWDQYLEDKWLPWLEEHNVWKKVHQVYSALFAIHQKQLRLGEEYELVIGLGLLTWQTPTGQRIRRHLLVADAMLEFEARLGKFTVRPNTEGTKLRPELDMLTIEEQPARAEETAKDSLRTAEDDPWDRGCIEGVLQALVHSINSQGVYDDSLEARNAHASVKPIVEYAPALILRKRSTKGLTETLKRIKENIENGEDIPDGFGDIAEIPPKGDRKPNDGMEESNGAFDSEVFFPKPSNDEQRRIVDKIQATTGVLVQGPPGTGKSHTIANLICHLLATGQRTLITAKTPRALQVLERLVPDELRPLCINLLGSGLDERRSLESSVGGILRKNEGWNEKRAKRERTKLQERLQALREEKTKVTRRLRDIRESETHAHSIAEGAYRGTAARIAEAVNHDRARYEWFTASVPLDRTCQLSPNALRSVLVALRRFTSEKRRELGLAWPRTLAAPKQFADLVRNEIIAIEAERNSAQGADERVTDLLARNNPSAIEAIHNAFSSFRDTQRRLLVTPHSWMNDAIRDILGGNTPLWHELLRVTQVIITSLKGLVTVADEARIDFPNTIDIRLLHEDACKLREHTKNGGKLGWWVFRPKPVKERLYLVHSVKIGGRPCSTVKHFTTLADALLARIECEKAWTFWKGRSEKVEGPYALQLTAIESLHHALENALTLEVLVAKCRETIKQCPGISEPAWTDESQIDRIVASCRFALARIRKRLATEKIRDIEAPILPLAAKGSAHSVINDLLNAIRSRDIDRFSHCASTIQDLEKQCQHLQKLDEYLAKLRQLFPEFTESLEHTCNEICWEERIRHIGDAWHWAQARYWIEEYIRMEDFPALAKRAKQIEDEINSFCCGKDSALI